MNHNAQRGAHAGRALITPEKQMVSKARPRARSVFAKAISQLMQNRKWSQRDLAQHSGISQRQISNILNEKQSPTIDTAEALALAFHARAWELMIDQELNAEERVRLHHILAMFMASTTKERQFFETLIMETGKFRSLRNQ